MRSKTIQSNIPGFGFTYLPTYRNAAGVLKNSGVYWMQYETRTGPVRRSTHCRDQQDAFQELMKVAGERATGGILDRSPERVRIGQLLDVLITSYADKRTLHDLECRIKKHLRPAFGDVKAVELRKRDLDGFVSKLKRCGLSPATINRCLANLHRALQLGCEEDPPLVLRIPKFPWQDEKDNVRQGILTYPHYTVLRDDLGVTARHARLVLVIGYFTGMRRGEILSLRWDQVDFDNGVIHLQRKQTKNKTPRVAPIYGEMRAYLEMGKIEHDANYPDCPYVISFNGQRVFDIKTSWNAAVERCAIDRVLVHDLRRTAITNMDDAGIPRHVAMSISGHKTESAYRRYLIGSQRQAIAAGKTMEVFFGQQKRNASPKGTQAVQ